MAENAAVAAIVVRGERNTGTSLVRAILRENYATLPFDLQNGLDMDGKYGWKHGFLRPRELAAYEQSTDETIVMVRDIWTWLLSTYRHSYTHGMDPQHMTFSEFLRAPYTYECWPPAITDCAGPMEEAPNFIQLRTSKYKTWLEYPRSTLVRMEDLTENAQGLLNRVVHAPRTSPSWIDVKGYTKYQKVNAGVYRPMARDDALQHYTDDDVAFVLGEMDSNFEHHVLGYPDLATSNPPNAEIPIIIMAHKRVEYMKQTMASIYASDSGSGDGGVKSRGSGGGDGGGIGAHLRRPQEPAAPLSAESELQSDTGIEAAGGADGGEEEPPSDGAAAASETETARRQPAERRRKYHRIFFLHISSCGGSTMCALATENGMRTNANANCNPPGDNAGTLSKVLSEAPRKSAGCGVLHEPPVSELTFVANEKGLPDEPWFDSDYLYVTSLRHPYERELSSYERTRKFDKKATSEDYSFLQYLRETSDNAMVRRLAGASVRRSGAPVDEEAFVRARATLERFDLVLILDTLNDGVAAMSAMLDIPWGQIDVGGSHWKNARRDQTPVTERFADEPEVGLLLREKFDHDLRLYQRAVELNAVHLAGETTEAAVARDEKGGGGGCERCHDDEPFFSCTARWMCDTPEDCPQALCGEDADTRPPGEGVAAYTCSQQREWGKCGEPWMAGYCCRTCHGCDPVCLARRR